MFGVRARLGAVGMATGEGVSFLRENARKQSPPTRARGKDGYRRLEAILEAANVVVQRVDTENDIGRDAFVDIVEGTDVTGGVVCVQVKSGASYCHRGTWIIPGKAADFALWRESTVPFFGVVHDAESGALRWVDLSEAAHLARDSYLSTVIKGPYGVRSVPVPDENRLDLDVIPFIAAAGTALKRRSGAPTTALLSAEVAKVEGGIADAFAIGRRDPTSLLLLAALLHRLPQPTRRAAIGVLAMTTSHPDIFWGRHNWIPDEVRKEIRRRIHWTNADVLALLDEIDEAGIQRGSLGQSIFHVLALDRELESKLFRAALDRQARDGARFWAAAILLYMAGDDAAPTLERLVQADESRSGEGLFAATRALSEIESIELLIESVQDFGYVSLF
jgi:hypothetical protein